jgi:hypothetical protein
MYKIHTCQHVEGDPENGVPIKLACLDCRSWRVIKPTRCEVMRSASLRGRSNRHERTPALLRDFMRANNTERRRASSIHHHATGTTICRADYYTHRV